MKALLSVLLFAALVCAAAPAFSAPRQVIQGTQVRLTLLNTIGTASSRDGDPFVAVVSEPVFMGNQLLIPAGTRVNGTVGAIEKARRFSVFRGQAYINLTFRTMEIDSRLIPVQMSILMIQQPASRGETKRRKDVKVDEGSVIEQKHDYKGDIIGGTAGAGGGAVVGAVFSQVVRGFGLGLVGGAGYIMARKGKEVELPAQTGLLVRTENTITVPAVSESASGYGTSR
jgi:hypothetical protein